MAGQPAEAGADAVVRLDVREYTRLASQAEREHNGTALALVSLCLLEEWTDWSEPVQLRAQIGDDGLVEFEIRTVEKVRV